ncbi:MAG: YihY/virulence factor BrkB family protein [Syntrophaceae bacterium]|nr:YihY/virulence factor BrkB family protein [Syntrophaceae bacterium]
MIRVYKALASIGRVAGFLMRVLNSFRLNQGMLLSGAVAYYTLLSIIPMLILILIVLSHYVEQERLLETVTTYLEMFMPGYAASLAQQVKVFLQYRRVIGLVGFAILLFFSSVAFTVLENAISVIFHRVRRRRRHFLVSSILPYAFIVLIGVSILFLSFVNFMLEPLEGSRLVVFGRAISLGPLFGLAVYLLGLVAEVFLITALYLVLPVGSITFRHAFVGGLAAAVLWEITRRAIIWYYKTYTFVNLIYGSFASLVVFLLSVEAVAIIVLLGAQVIAELEHVNEKIR